MRLYDYDPWLNPYKKQINQRTERLRSEMSSILSAHQSLKNYANYHNRFGLHKEDGKWVFREWAPNATGIYLVGEFSKWQPLPEFALNRKGAGVWEITLPLELLSHGDLFKLWMEWEGGAGMRIPTTAVRTVQDPDTLLFSAQVWDKPDFKWSDSQFKPSSQMPIIYEAHTGMAQEEPKVGSYREFADLILPRIKRAGYNTIQLMAIQEHPYYGSFGYHVSNFFATSSRFGTPDDLKYLVNKAHRMGIAVIMDLVHSHAVKNEEEGLSRFDGSYHQFFHAGERGMHPAWDSRCFDYGKEEVRQFLLSNCRYWIEMFHMDGFRFDGVTSMLYWHHGLEKAFTGYDDYFSGDLDDNAVLYLTLANCLIHELKPSAITVAEEMSGLPGITALPIEDGLGFDYRLSMGVPDFWIKLIKEKADEAWSVSHIFHELTQHRPEEKVISYAESHDQALVGDKTIIFRLADKEMYDKMAIETPSLVIDRAIALHKMIRLVTLTTAYGGYLNFMGNEFGHPEWIDFPREGNQWSCQYARRQWSLVDNALLKYQWLGQFDEHLIHFAEESGLLSIPEIYLRHSQEADQVLAYERGAYLFVFNFNPKQSFTDYGIAVKPGKFKIILATDDIRFGGFGNVDQSVTFYSDIYSGLDHHQIRFYLPARSAMVLERLPVPSIYDI